MNELHPHWDYIEKVCKAKGLDANAIAGKIGYYVSELGSRNVDPFKEIDKLIEKYG